VRTARIWEGTKNCVPNKKRKSEIRDVKKSKARERNIIEPEQEVMKAQRGAAL